MFDFEGAGIILTIMPGSKDTRRKPFKLTSSRRKGRCKLYRTVEVRLKKNDEVVGVASTKTEALSLAKKLIRKLREDLYAKTVYNSEDTDFDLDYVPSINSKKGQYIVFGVDGADVKLSRRKNRISE